MCDPILVTVLKMRHHYSQASRENATPSSGTSPLAFYKEVPPPPTPHTPRAVKRVLTELTHRKQWSIALIPTVTL